MNAVTNKTGPSKADSESGEVLKRRTHVILIAALVLAGCSAAPPVLSSNQGCTITGEGTESDRVLAEQACFQARDGFEELFGNPVPPVLVELHAGSSFALDIADSGAAEIKWPNAEGLTRNARALHEKGTTDALIDRFVEAGWAQTLPHEISHLLLFAKWFPPESLDSDSGRRYGSPLPDWLDEAAAIWGESPHLQAQRLAQARELPPESRTLEAILSAEHPSLRSGRRNEGGVMSRSTTYGECIGDCGDHPDEGTTIRRTVADGVLTVDTLEADSPEQEFRADKSAFYPKSIAVLTFVFERGGSPAVRTLRRRLMDDDDQDPAVLAGLPGLPETPEQVEALWEDWLETEEE